MKLKLKLKRRVCLDEHWVEINEIVCWKRNYQTHKECGLAETLISNFGDTEVFILNKFKKKNVLTPILISFYFQLTKLCDDQLWRYKQQNQQVIKVVKQDNQSYKNKRYWCGDKIKSRWKTLP